MKRSLRRRYGRSAPATNAGDVAALKASVLRAIGGLPYTNAAASLPLDVRIPIMRDRVRGVPRQDVARAFLAAEAVANHLTASRAKDAPAWRAMADDLRFAVAT